ncbi:MAG: EAL domain-containing protein [Gammaproteobacteria bacterium]|nr:MAG: EAL domain-containing protein [Gammaproteobacteria bacterium]
MTEEHLIRRILILDDDSDYRRLLLTHLKKLFPGTELVEYDPVANGVPGDAFDWAAYDVLLLDYYLCIHGVTGLDILQANRKNALFPATLMLTGAGTEEVAAKAIRAGVYDFIRKDRLDKNRLVSAIRLAHKKHRLHLETLREVTSQSKAFNKAIFYRSLELAGESADEKVLMLVQLDRANELQNELGLVLLTNILRHLSRMCLDLLDKAGTGPAITRLSDSATAIIMDQNGTLETLAGRARQLCEALAGNPYVYQDRVYPYTVSMGIVPLREITGTAEQIIALARADCDIAKGSPGNSYHIHATAYAGAIRTDSPPPQPEALTVPDTPAKPDISPAPPSVSMPTVPETSHPHPVVEASDKPTTRGQKPAAPDRRSADRKIEVTKDEAVLDERQLSPAALPIKKAFDENRIVQTFQPVISLVSGAEATDELFVVSLQLVTTSGAVQHADNILQAVDNDAFKKFVDRWMLREAIARVIKNEARKTIFLLRLSEASLADAYLFNWLRQHLASVRDKLTEHSITPLISADGFLHRKKQAEALMIYLKKTFGFGFALQANGPLEELHELTHKGLFDYLIVDHFKIPEMQAFVPVKAQKQDLLASLKAAGLRIVTDGIKDANELTEAIHRGVDYAMGPFVGDEITQIDESSNLESFEIT